MPVATALNARNALPGYPLHMCLNLYVQSVKKITNTFLLGFRGIRDGGISTLRLNGCTRESWPDASLLVWSRQPRLQTGRYGLRRDFMICLQPLIPEFHHFKRVSVQDPVPDNCKQLPPNVGGEAEDAAPALSSLADTVKLGFYHTPKQFLAMAMGVQHPMDTSHHVESPTSYALSFVLKHSDEVVKLERKKNLLPARLMAKRLVSDFFFCTRRWTLRYSECWAGSACCCGKSS
ncbi:unnamed protein product [Effrenium voratum]|nr:unnamed protein product [Effrenium voratum]